MKRPWLVYSIVIVVSVVAGVAIAGLPSASTADPVVPTTTEAPSTTEATFTSTPEESSTTPSETITTSDPTTTVEAATTSAPTTTTTMAVETTTTTTPIDRAVVVSVANGSRRSGLASETAGLLAGRGWSNLRAINGLDRVDTTIVYFADGLEASAAALAADLGLPATSVAPLASAPPVDDLGLTQVLAYLGADRA